MAMAIGVLSSVLSGHWLGCNALWCCIWRPELPSLAPQPGVGRLSPPQSANLYQFCFTLPTSHQSTLLAVRPLLSSAAVLLLQVSLILR